jgi:murein DD-endopeptidase MepM/ murein hydrolase activator NlpD
MSEIAGAKWPTAACIAFVLTLPVLLSACASDAPRDTNFDWNLASDGPGSSTGPEGSTAAPAAGDEQTAPEPKQLPGWYNQKSQPVTVSPLPAPTGPVSFGWPMRGKIVSDFGSMASGERNNGINIAAALGTPIHAAADGVVSYAGNELKGYGNLVLIRHSNDYVTAYAHAESILVTRGDKVVMGQVIGYAGATGDVDAPQLHFEIRHGTAPVNPRPLLMAAR